MLVGGEAPDQTWRRLFQSRLVNIPVKCYIEPALGYFSEQRVSPIGLAKRTQQYLDHLLRDRSPKNCLVWFHNSGLGRNVFLLRELTRICAAQKLNLLLHHHDWWFDNRWLRWPEMYRCGVRSLKAAAPLFFPAVNSIRHISINQADAEILQQHFPSQTAWVPNLAEPTVPPKANRVRLARKWLHEQLGEQVPVWLLPCRLLRRKNVTEALLLTRWLRPQAWLVTTGGVSSADEQPYATQLGEAALKHGWPLRLGILQGDESKKPTVSELLAASEAVVLTSIQEGFGLPYLEAATAQRPLIARALPNIAPDLAKFGFVFPQYYDDLLVGTELFDWRSEQKRQKRLFHGWITQLPKSCRKLVELPIILTDRSVPRSVPFSQLTLTSQLEILTQPVDKSWELCAPLNPFLRGWQQRAAQQQLRVTHWPRSASRWLGGKAYARHFQQLIDPLPVSQPERGHSFACQQAFMRAKLQSKYLYPLLWNSHP